MRTFLSWLPSNSPFVPILRGITPDEVVAVGEALHDAGWRVFEVPLNSPDAFESIKRLQQRFGDDTLVGAGTVRREAEVERLVTLGARLMVCPHTDVRLIAAAKAAGLFALPGVATASECMAALDAGADGLKLFPADALGPATLKALRSVLPRDTCVLPVGGIAPTDVSAWVQAGAAAFGIGGALYRPGSPAHEVGTTAQAFNNAWHLLAR